MKETYPTPTRSIPRRTVTQQPMGYGLISRHPKPTRGKKPPAPSVTRVKTKSDNYAPNFTGTRMDWEETIFLHANHFTVFRLHRKTSFRPVERVSAVFSTFPEAITEARLDVNALVYAVTLSGDAFCVPRTDWDRYLRIWDTR